MRADGDCSDTSQTRSDASSEKTTNSHASDEVLQPFQTSAIRLDGRKGENSTCTPDTKSLEGALEDALKSWRSDSNQNALRHNLLRIPLCQETFIRLDARAMQKLTPEA